jgi:hypothetical protein
MELAERVLNEAFQSYSLEYVIKQSITQEKQRNQFPFRNSLLAMDLLTEPAKNAAPHQLSEVSQAPYSGSTLQNDDFDEL